MRYHTAVPIARGGMGEVLEAWDPVLERTVALKVLHRLEPEVQARMLREARAQARVDHPNVCKVFDVGETDEGRPFVAMQRIEGVPLDEAVGELTLEDIVRLAGIVADAVQAAHEAGLVHRDLKPANILVEGHDSGAPVPFVLDFGIAREVDAKGLTRTGMAVGTPGYMSPEQARGERRVDRRTDVFSLGVVLYEILADRLPFGGDSSFEILASLLRDDPAPLRRVAPEVPVDLATIVMKAIDRSPDRRYASMRAFADDLRRFLAGEPILARPLGPIGRSARWVRRHPTAAAASGLAVITVVLLAAWGVRERWRGEVRERQAGRVASALEEIDASLRFAHLAPLHDRQPTVEAVRERARRLLAEIEDGDTSEDLASWARGRLAFALGDREEARRHLQAAWEGGLRSPELRASLGRTLALLYEREAERARRLRDPEERERALAELGTSLREPALDHLRAASRERPAEAALTRARIALLEERWDDAIGEARSALARSPWLYEAWLTIANVALLRCSDLEAQGLHAEAAVVLAEAAEALGEAVLVGRSDPVVHERRCAWWARRVDLDRAVGRDLAPAYEGLHRACGDALTADRESFEAWYQLSRAHWRWAAWIQRHGGDPEPTLEALVEAAGRASEIRPDDHRAPNMLGLGWWQRALYRERRGESPLEEVQRALEAFDRSSRADPAYRHPPNNRANVLLLLAGWEEGQGAIPEETLRRAVAAYEEAIDLDPDYPLPHSNLSLVLAQLGRLAALLGEDPGPDYRRAREHLDRALELNPRYWNALNHLASLELRRARWWTHRDRERARFHLRAALEAAERAIEQNATVNAVWSNRAAIHRLEGLVALLDGDDPRPAWREAELALRRLAALDATFPEGLEQELGLEIDRALVALREEDRRAIRRGLEATRNVVSRLCRELGEHPLCRSSTVRVALLEAFAAASEPDFREALGRLGESAEALTDGRGAEGLVVEAWIEGLRAWREGTGASWGGCRQTADQAISRAPLSAEARALHARCDLASPSSGSDPAEARARLDAALSVAPELARWPLFAASG